MERRADAHRSRQLLKLIEEPPANTLILLTAQSVDAMLKTILSRTQQILVPPIDIPSIANALTEQKNIAPAAAQEYAQLSGGDYAEALEMASPNSASEEFWGKFAQLMHICTGNKADNVIALLMWADDVCKKSGREEQKQFLGFALRMLRNGFLFGQNIAELDCMADRVRVFASCIHCGNAEHLYNEFNLASGQLSANGNARLIFTDLALKVIKHIHSYNNQR